MESSPELNSFINSPSQTIPTENSSITNLKGLYGNLEHGANLNHDALHSILSSIEQNRNADADAVDNDDEILTKPEYINPVLLSSNTVPKLPSSLSPKGAEAEGAAPLMESSNNNLFIDSHMGNEFGEYVGDLFDGYVERDSLVLENEDEDEDDLTLGTARRGSALLTPSNLMGNLRKASLPQGIELPSSGHAQLRTKSELERAGDESDTESEAQDSSISKSLSQYSLNFHTATKLTKYRNRRQSVHGTPAMAMGGVTKRNISMESPLTSPSRTLQALNNSNNQYRLSTNSTTLNNLFSWENAILSDDDDSRGEIEGDRRNNFIASPTSTSASLSTVRDADDNELEIVEPSVNISPVFNPKSLSALDPKYIGGPVNKPGDRGFAAPISLSSRTRVNAMPPTPASTVSSSFTRRRRRSAITPVTSRINSSSRRNKSISVELSDGESKPFQCGDCDKAFRRSEHLKRHIRSVHSNDRPFPCMFCEKKFSRSDNLSQHLKTHKKHGDF